MRFCDGRENKLPFQSNYKMSGVYPLGWDITLSGSFQSTQAGTEETTFYTITRTLPYPANCPAPCPAGALVVGSQLTRSTLSVNLNAPGTEFGDRINQLDLKVTRTFRRGRVQISPALELFNILKSHDMLDCLQLVHCHPGSQLQDIRRVKDAINELAHVYAELKLMGA